MGHSRFGYEDDIVCHRAGYARITPQNCLERHVKNDELCGRCTWHRVAADTLAVANDKDHEEIFQITRNGDIYKYANPVIRPESIPDRDTEAAFDEDGKEGKKQMNTRIIYINGKRILQGLIVDYRMLGSMNERTLIALFQKDALGDTDKVKEISVDEFIGGRLMNRFQWARTDDKVYGPVMDGQKVTKFAKEIDCVGFRLVLSTADSFSR